MKKYLFIIFSLNFIIGNSYALTGNGNPLKYISSCELDLNGDNKIDITFLVETIEEGRQLIVLLKTQKGYECHVLTKQANGMHLSCNFGKSIQETKASKSKGRIYSTPGTFIKLIQPEGASLVYFWDKNKNSFIEVWTSD